MYLDVSNLGDLVIYDTSRYIVEDILKKNKIEDYEIIPIDIGSFKSRNLNNEKKGLRRILRGGLRTIAKSNLFSQYFPNISMDMLIKRWHLSDTYEYFAKNEKHKLNDVDLIIFGGGGLIKFHKQNFHYFLDDITKYAEERNIPVLLNAQGIEGYDEYDPECQLLKKAVNRDCVKYVSTRDDFAMLRNCYVDNPKTVVKSVCDPAFWVSETYHIQKDNLVPKKVGLNVIRTKIFGEYMYGIKRDTLGEIYHDLIVKLFNEGYSVELFSNGVLRDAEFIDWLLENYPDLQDKFKVTVANPDSTKALVKTLAGYDRYMAVRLHAAIIGTVLGIPNVSLVWNRKQILFGKEIGLPQNFITKEKFNVDDIFNLLCDAEPYKMDVSYKMSVYQNLEEQLMKWIKG